jgi:hypothetical protein
MGARFPFSEHFFPTLPTSFSITHLFSRLTDSLFPTTSLAYIYTDWKLATGARWHQRADFWTDRLLLYLLDTLEMATPSPRRKRIRIRHKKKKARMSLQPLPLAVFFPPEPENQPSSEPSEPEKGKYCLALPCLALCCAFSPKEHCAGERSVFASQTVPFSPRTTKC